MRVLITDIDQRYSLQSKAVSNIIVLRLPSGISVKAVVADDVVARIIAESEGTAPEPMSNGVEHGKVELMTPTSVPTRPAVESVQPGDEENPFLAIEVDNEPRETPVDYPEQERLEHHVENGLVDWTTLPESQLPPSIRHVLQASGVKHMITIEDLDRLKLEIIARLSRQPKAGQVDWDSGPRRRVESAPRRVIRMDEAGNPIPPGGITEMRDTNDPGEVRDDEEVQQA